MEIKVGYKPSKIHVWVLALIFIPLGMALFGLWYFHIEPIYTTLTPIVEGARGIGQAVIPTLQNAYATFLQNPIPYIAATVTTVSGLYAIASKLRSVQAENAKQQAEAQATQQAMVAQNQLVQQNQTLTEAQNEAATLKQQLTELQSGDSSKLLGEAQSLVTLKTEENKKLAAQIEILSRIGSPSELEMVNKLKAQGYEVIKKIVVK